MPPPLEPYDDYRSEGSTILVFLVVLSNSRSYVIEFLTILTTVLVEHLISLNMSLQSLPDLFHFGSVCFA
ncbi:hypothetical protein NC651_005351 [Populus alba x Populus x berolinensis]|nr:hypothetical protein NC651_005351 [Populus alba x Populus x berolinensis]